MRKSNLRFLLTGHAFSCLQKQIPCFQKRPLVKCFIVFAFLYCSYEIKKRGSVGTHSLKSALSENSAGTLKIKIRSEEVKKIRNVRITLSKTLPEFQYHTRWILSAPLPPIPVRLPAIQLADPNPENFEIFTLEGERDFSIQPGRYYLSMDTLLNESFEWNSQEGQFMYFPFGFRDRYYFDSKERIMDAVTNYDKKCENKKTDYFPVVYYLNIGSCSQLEIKAGKTSVLSVNAGRRYPSSNIVYIRKAIGFPFLFPFTNQGGYYYQRDYTVNLENPD